MLKERQIAEEYERAGSYNHSSKGNLYIGTLTYLIISLPGIFLAFTGVTECSTQLNLWQNISFKVTFEKDKLK